MFRRSHCNRQTYILQLDKSLKREVGVTIEFLVIQGFELLETGVGTKLASMAHTIRQK